MEHYKDFYKHLLDESNIKTYDYASTHVSLSESDATPIKDFIRSIPKNEIDESEGGKEFSSHITVLFGIKDKAEVAVPKIKKILKGVKSITVKLGKISIFENEGFDVLKIDVKSPDLIKINKLFRKNLEYHSDYPGYHAHLTCAFLKKGFAKKYSGDTRFEGKTMTFNTIIFSDKRDSNIEKHIVLELKVNEDLGYGGGMPSGQSGLSGQTGTFASQYTPTPTVNTDISTYSPQNGNTILNYGNYDSIKDEDLKVPGIDPDELREGMRWEMKRMKWPDKDIAKRIAIANIQKDSKYYSNLKMYNENKDMNEPTDMKTICAWCKDVIKQGDESKGISHGICPKCYEKTKKEIEDMRKNRNVKEDYHPDEEETGTDDHDSKLDSHDEQNKCETCFGLGGDADCGMTCQDCGGTGMKSTKENLNEQFIWNKPLVDQNGKKINVNLNAIADIIKDEQDKRKSKKFKKLTDMVNIVTPKPKEII